MSKLVSVIIPFVEENAFLEQAIFSVYKQSYNNIELILVCDNRDCELGRTVNFLNEFGLPNKVLRNPRKGVSSARNLGVHHADGEFIAFLDSDDLLSVDSILSRMELLARCDSEHVVGVISPAYMIDENAEKISDTPVFEYSFPNSRIYASSSPDCLFNPSCLILKKESFLRVGGFDESMELAEDYDLWFRLLAQDNALYILMDKNPFVSFRQHNDNTSSDRVVEHYFAVKNVRRRIFSLTRKDEEKSYGYWQYKKGLVKQAFSRSIYALALDEPSACEIIREDIDIIFLNQIFPETLASMAEFQILRVFPKKRVGSNIRQRIIEFIDGLDNESAFSFAGKNVVVRRLNSFMHG